MFEEDFKTVYNCYHDLANYFLLTDDIWLSNHFYEKCLTTAEECLSQIAPEHIAEAHCNLGLSFERESKFDF